MPREPHTAAPPTPASIAAGLSVAERVMLFCLATDTDWTQASIPQATVRHMRVSNLVDRDRSGHMVLTEQGRAVFNVLVRKRVEEHAC